MTDTEKEITKTITSIGDKLNNEYLKAGSKSKQKRILYDLYTYENFCNTILEINNKHKWYMNDELIPDNNQFLDTINKNKKYYFKLSKEVINSFIKEKYPLYRNYGKQLPKLNYNEMAEILKEFLKEFDQNILNKFDNKIRENKVLETQIKYYEGYILPFESIKDSLIILNNDSDNYNLSFMMTLAHEFGHFYEIEHLYSQDNISFRKNSMMSPYCEVSSSFLEYAFLMYLKENKIFEHSTNLCLTEYYIRVFVYNFCMHLISMKKDINPYIESVYIEEENIKQYADYIMKKTNYYGIQEYNQGLDYRDSYIYAIGGIYAINMYEKYKENKEYFKEELKKSFLIYPNNFSPEVFKNLGIDNNQIKNNEVLKKVLRNR